jgi:uncharacterized protein YukE
MAEKFDVGARLAEGMPSVSDVQELVWACRAVGYENADLTGHAAQVLDSYTSEEGLDLRALDADCVALHAAARATQEALAQHVEQLGALPAAWQGNGGEACREFLRRYGTAAAQSADAVRTAADALADLRDTVWQAVDTKVGAVQSIDGRVQPQWLTAAHTVATGAGDRAAASELIDQQVKPFVDNDIRMDWMAAMQSAMTAIAEAYEAAVSELSSDTAEAFEVPGDFGPVWTPTATSEAEVIPAAPTVPATVPAAVISTPPAWSSPPMPQAAAPLPQVAPPPVDPAAAAAAPVPPTAAPPLGGMGGGVPDIAGGFSGIGQQLADAIGSLLGSSTDALDEMPKVDEPEGIDDDIGDDMDDDVDDEAKEDDEPDEAEGEGVDGVGDEAAETTDTEAAAEPEPICEPPPPVPTSAPLPPTPEPIPADLPPADPVVAETPCEIAADELPQVGE